MSTQLTESLPKVWDFLLRLEEYTDAPASTGKEGDPQVDFSQRSPWQPIGKLYQELNEAGVFHQLIDHYSNIFDDPDRHDEPGGGSPTNSYWDNVKRRLLDRGVRGFMTGKSEWEPMFIRAIERLEHEQVVAIVQKPAAHLSAEEVVLLLRESNRRTALAHQTKSKPTEKSSPAE